MVTKAGFIPASVSIVVSARTCSSVSNMTMPLRVLTSTGTICSFKIACSDGGGGALLACHGQLVQGSGGDLRLPSAHAWTACGRLARRVKSISSFKPAKFDQVRSGVHNGCSAYQKVLVFIPCEQPAMRKLASNAVSGTF